MPKLSGLNPETQPRMGGIRLLEPGIHTVKIVNTEIGPTWDGNGENVVVHFQAPTGETPRAWFTYVDKVEKWKQEKGQEQLALLCECVGVDFMGLEVRGTEVLHGRDVQVVIAHKEKEKTRDDGTTYIQTNMVCADYMSVPATTEATPKAGAPW